MMLFIEMQSDLLLFLKRVHPKYYLLSSDVVVLRLYERNVGPKAAECSVFSALLHNKVIKRDRHLNVFIRYVLSNPHATNPSVGQRGCFSLLFFDET